MYKFMTIQENGKVTQTDDFGTCSDVPTVSDNQDAVMVALEDTRGRGTETWKYENDTLTQVGFLDPNVEKNAPHLFFVEDSIVSVRGTLVRTPSGKNWHLKLPGKTFFDGGSGSWCSTLMDALPIDSGAIPPQATGEREFDVTISCPHAGAYISTIALAADRTTLLHGTWSCSTDRGNGTGLITFSEGGKLEWIVDPGTVTQSHRIGTFQVRQQSLVIAITQIPELSKLGRSPNVALAEGGAINSIDSDTLKFTWWQNSAPNDRVMISCARYRPTQPRQSPSPHAAGNYIPAGSIVCLNPRSFYKVNAMEIAGNRYASLPDDCDTLGANAQVNILHELSDPVVGNLVQVGNTGATVFVRQRDLR